MMKNREMGNWISVKERLPEPEGEYIVCVYGNSVGVAYYGSRGALDQFYREDYDIFEDHMVTHWMPLPEPPKSESPTEKEYQP